MTVIIEKPAINLREELADLRNQGTYQEQQFYFDSLVTNGTFDTDTDWTKGTGVTISGGVVNATSATSIVTQTMPLVSNSTYYVSFDYTMSAGASLRVEGSGVLAISPALGASGTVTLTIVANSTTFKIAASGANFTGTIDNVSVFETDGTDVVHPMPKGWVPKDVYEDGLLQREGAAHDYEVVYDGFDYYVKPTVAPSATTTTCVIGVRK